MEWVFLSSVCVWEIWLVALVPSWPTLANCFGKNVLLAKKLSIVLAKNGRGRKQFSMNLSVNNWALLTHCGILAYIYMYIYIYVCMDMYTIGAKTITRTKKILEN